VGGGVVPRRARTAALALGALLLAAACAETVQVRKGPAPDQALALRRLAVAPFRAVERRDAAVLRADAAPLVAGYVSEAFGARGVEVVSPSDVAQALGLYAEAGGAIEPRRAAEEVHRRFGANALALGRVGRFRERAGEAMGTTSPASVSFEVSLYAAPGGSLLWKGVFDETQVALGENVLRAARYPGGGTRWLSAEELARWGASEIAAQVPLAPPSPSP
jgi:hypothetical protein